MNYLSLENITKSYGERILFEKISFGINKDQKVGFIAKNGTGKTSLLNIINERESADSGNIVKRKELKISYLSQKDDFDDNLSIEEIIFKGNNETLIAIKEYENAINNIENAENYQLALEKMERFNAWDFETRYKQILTKLDITNTTQKIGTLSGGQRKRLGLASVLIENPDFLILDEPTNHLDLEMIEWLENYLNNQSITLFMVTHDRYFLDRVCNEIIELDEGKIYKYKGNYQYFLEKREERLENEKINVEKAKNLFRKELDWMRRQPKARTTKSKSRIDDFNIIKEKASQRRNDHKVQLEINMARMGSKIVEFHNVHKSLGDKKLLDDFKYTFKNGERIGIIGKNGTGKTTFLNLLTGKVEVDAGKIVIGETVKFGYYSQKGINIKSGQKVIEVIKEFGEFIPLAKGQKISASQLLEKFLFDPKKQYDFVEKLSGGEQKRLFLCTILIQNPNFLIFDEPTNDLDLVTLNVLEEFLLDFPGNLIVVSHDRYFMDKIIDSLFIFEGNGKVENFPANYTDYRFYKDSLEEEELFIKKEETKNKISYQEQQKINSLESSIKRLQKQKEELENIFSNSSLSSNEISKKSLELKKIIKEIESKEEEWFDLLEK